MEPCAVSQSSEFEFTSGPVQSNRKNARWTDWLSPQRVIFSSCVLGIPITLPHSIQSCNPSSVAPSHPNKNFFSASRHTHRGPSNIKTPSFLPTSPFLFLSSSYFFLQSWVSECLHILFLKECLHGNKLWESFPSNLWNTSSDQASPSAGPRRMVCWHTLSSDWSTSSHRRLRYASNFWKF